MTGELSLQNRQRTCAVELRLLRRIIITLLTDLLSAEIFELAVHLVAAPEMTRLNEKFLNHAGSTDVITFDYESGVPLPNGMANEFPGAGNVSSTGRRRTEPQTCAALHGDICICVDEAVAQSRQFRTTWQSELVRYLIHGLLHLRGHGDQQPAARRRMKREEERLLRQLSQQFQLALLDRAMRSGKSQIANRKCPLSLEQTRSQV